MPVAQKPPIHMIEGAPDSAIGEGERKTVTALFADIKGSMELMEDLDPEEARAIVDPALRLMIDAVHRYDGYVVQSTGDGIFALFGAPVAHEDHPQRALYPALRLQEEMRRYAVRLRQQGRPPVQIRVGINTGEVVVRSIHTDEAHTEYNLNPAVPRARVSRRATVAGWKLNSRAALAAGLISFGGGAAGLNTVVLLAGIDEGCEIAGGPYPGGPVRSSFE
jgi:class 3 adenylate cyclase